MSNAIATIFRGTRLKDAGTLREPETLKFSWIRAYNPRFRLEPAELMQMTRIPTNTV